MVRRTIQEMQVDFMYVCILCMYVCMYVDFSSELKRKEKEAI